MKMKDDLVCPECGCPLDIHVSITQNFDKEFKKKLIKEIDYLEITVRTSNALKKANIQYITDLIKLTESEVRVIPGIGVACLNEIKDVLKEHGLSLKNS